MKYSHVCGRVIGYQDGSPDAFGRYFASRETAIDSIYVDGVSLTHGQSPRQHIWTFVGALQETGPDINRISLCPCTQLDVPYIGTIPSIVGQDYFCDTGSRSVWSNIFYSDDPLWMVRDAGVTALAVSSTIHHGSASSSLSKLLMILS